MANNLAVSKELSCPSGQPLLQAQEEERHTPPAKGQMLPTPHTGNMLVSVGGTNTQPITGTKFILLSSQKMLFYAVKEF